MHRNLNITEPHRLNDPLDSHALKTKVMLKRAQCTSVPSVQYNV